jgi:hypothetical protein
MRRASHLAADVVAVGQLVHLRLVEHGIFLEALDPLLKGPAKSRADLKAFAGGAFGVHRRLLEVEMPEAGEVFPMQPQVFLTCADISEDA